MFIVYIVFPTERNPAVSTVEASFAVEAANAAQAQALAEAYEPLEPGAQLVVVPAKEAAKSAAKNVTAGAKVTPPLTATGSTAAGAKPPA